MRGQVLAVVRRHGWNATSFQVLERGFSYWFDGADACVAYVDTGGAWVAAGAPVCAPERLAEVSQRFFAAAASHGRRACFFGAEARLVRATELTATRIGDQPVWDPAAWHDTVASARTLRSQVRRACAKGVTVRALLSHELGDEGTRAGIDGVVRRFLASRRMAPMGFLVDVQPFAFPGERRAFVAERGGVLVGVAVAVPVFARGGWLLEDLIRAPDAPNGTVEQLVDATMRAIAHEGSRYATLGLAPLAGDVGPFLRFARALARPLYDFRGLAAFKAKLGPSRWDPIYLAFPRDTHPGVAMLDGLAAFARGDLAGFAAETLAHALGW